ncbi:MAG: DUF4091 domain-containing protein [Armatimonadetes bacterium]|nr:DUF4091 domain-containing protein [Armatimonadota bacterium]
MIPQFRRYTPLNTAWAAVLLVALCLTAAADDPAVDLLPVAVCPTVDWPPLLDGDLNETAWDAAGYVGPLTKVGTYDLPAEATACQVMLADNRLWLGITCFEGRMSCVAANAEGRDHPRAWTDDCVHVFIATGNPAVEYYHLVVTVGNSVLDERVYDAGQERDVRWNADIETAVQRLSDRWTCEISVALPPAESAGRPWRFNLARTETPSSEWTSWGPLNASLHEFQHFGRLVPAGSPVIRTADIGRPFLGRNDFRVAVTSASPGQHADVEVIRDGRAHTKARVPLRSGSAAAMSYEIRDEGRAAVRLAVRDAADGSLRFATPPVWFEVRPVRELVERAVTTLDNIAQTVRTAANDLLRREILREVRSTRRDASAIMDDAEALIDAGTVSPTAWNALHERAVGLGPRLRIAQYKSRLAAQGNGRLPGFALGVEHALRKLRPDDASYRIAQNLALSGGRRERTSGQVVIVSLGQTIDGLKVDWTDLIGPKGARIGRDAVHVSRVGYVKTRPPVYEVEYVGEWPDPLLPVEPLSVSAGRIQPLWVTVSIPPDARPGQYSGEITVTTEKEPAQRVALQVDVWDLELPLHGRFQTGFGNAYYGDLVQWYGLPRTPPEDFRKQFYQLLLNNRVNPAGLYIPETWPLPEDFDWCYERGMNALCLGNLDTASPDRLREIARLALWLQGKQRLGMGYVYGFGLDSPEDLERARWALEQLKDLAPGLRRAAPVKPTSELFGLANIWGTLTSEFSSFAAGKRMRLGDEVWWYVCCGPRHPYGNFFIDYPAIDARALFWAAYRYRVTGFFYYEVAMWASNMLTMDTGGSSLVLHDDPDALAALRNGKRWPEVPWNTYTFSRYNGDGQLIYPGPGQKLLPSLRLEVIRDGIEDYELLALLDDLAAQLKAHRQGGRYQYLVDEARVLTSVRETVLRDLTDFTQDPLVLLAEREALARQAQRLQRVLRELG